MTGRGYRRPARGAGFTLIEVLVGLTLFALVSVSLFSGVWLGVRSWESGARSSERFNQMRIVQEFIRRHLGKALPLAVNDRGQWRVWFDGSADRLVFLTEMPGYVGTGGMYEVSLSVEHTAGEPRLVLARRLLQGVEEGDQASPPESSVLIEDLSELEFSYFGRPFDDAEPGWYPEWRGATALPGLVRMRADTPGGPPWPELLIAPRVTEARYRRSRRGVSATGFLSAPETRASARQGK